MSSCILSSFVSRPGSCKIDLICFVAVWYKRSLNQTLALFGSVFAYASSFPVHRCLGFCVVLRLVMCSFVNISLVIG